MLNRAAILLLLCLGLPLGQAAGRTGAAVTVHPLATKAAMNAFERGGNAVDAVVAAALTLGVVDGFNSGIGGGCFMLIRKPNGSIRGDRRPRNGSGRKRRPRHVFARRQSQPRA